MASTVSLSNTIGLCHTKHHHNIVKLNYTSNILQINTFSRPKIGHDDHRCFRLYCLSGPRKENNQKSDYDATSKDSGSKNRNEMPQNADFHRHYSRKEKKPFPVPIVEL